MLDIFKLLIDWRELFEIGGTDAVIYAGFALVGTAIFMIRLMLSLVLGVEGDMDLDLDSIGEGGGFGVLSVLSVTAFLMGTGWMGLIARLEWELGSIPSAFIASGSGLVLLFMSAGLMLLTKRAVHHVPLDIKDAVGKTASVYMQIPEKGSGGGQVRVSVQGRSMIVSAVSTGPAIASFTDVKVTGMRDEKTLVVEPA